MFVAILYFAYYVLLVANLPPQYNSSAGLLVLIPIAVIVGQRSRLLPPAMSHGGETVITTRHDELRQKFRSYLDQNRRLRSVVIYTKQQFDSAKTLTAHNWEHIYRDTLNAIVIGEAEGADMSVVLPAIVMHDIGYLYGPPEGHGPRGADKLPEYVEAAGISYSAAELAKQASCIRTHKGSMRDEHPDGLDAKVVADADLLDKFGALGVYQTIRSHGEFEWPLARVLEFMLAGKGSALTLETDTGRRLAEPGRRFVLDFYRALARAAEPYGDSSL